MFKHILIIALCATGLYFFSSDDGQDNFNDCLEMLFVIPLALYYCYYVGACFDYTKNTLNEKSYWVYDYIYALFFFTSMGCGILLLTYKKEYSLAVYGFTLFNCLIPLGSTYIADFFPKHVKVLDK